MIYKKSLNGQIDQGDILYPVRIKNYIPWWIHDDDYPIVILTPTCDIAQEKEEELIHRYSHHTMRIGTEDIPKEIVNKIIDDCFNLHSQLS